jgi:hypothetical protein
VSEYSGQIIYIYKNPSWVKALNLMMWLLLGYSMLIGRPKQLALWENGLLGKFFIIASVVFLIILTYGMYCHRVVITREQIYLRNWWKYREVSYQDISEMYVYGTGRVYFIPKDTAQLKRVETWVPPSKLQEVIDSATVADVFVIRVS